MIKKLPPMFFSLMALTSIAVLIISIFWGKADTWFDLALNIAASLLVLSISVFLLVIWRKEQKAKS